MAGLTRPVKLIVVALLSFSCWATQQVNAQQGVGLTLNSMNLTNNSIVTNTDIGTGAAALVCTTTYRPCCNSGNPESQWYFPNGSQVMNSQTLPYQRNRGAGRVNLNRNFESTTTGIFRCAVRDFNGVVQSLYVGIYDSGTGGVTITGEINFQLDSELNADPPVFTLTCTSTGGPATTVSWTRDGNGDTSQIVTNTETGTYTNTLRVAMRDVGVYMCTVSNSRSSDTRSLTVVEANSPTNLNAVRVNPTSIRVSWTAPASGATVMGYHIFWTDGTIMDSVGVGASATDHTITIPQPQSSSLIYSFTIVTLSTHLPSAVVGPAPVTVDPPPTPPAVTPGVATPTSVVVSWSQQASVDSYEISFQRATGNQQTGDCSSFVHSDTIPVGGATTMHNLTGLQEFSTYLITVTAVSNVRGRTGSNTLTVNTQRAAPSGGPQSLRELEITSTNITIAWDAVDCIERNSIITGYVVRYTPPSSSGNDSVMVAGTGGAGGMVTIDGLTPSAQYSIQVAAVNSDGNVGAFSTALSLQTLLEGGGIPTTTTTTTTTTTATTSNTTAGGPDAVGVDGGAVAGGIIGALLVVVLIVAIVIVGVWLWRRYSPQDKYSTKTSPPTRPPPPVHFKKAPQNGEGEKTVEPIIQEFPKDTHVTEGEGVSFKVKVSGHPKPTLLWYHEGKEVVSDYSLEVEGEGNLTIASSEPRHTGVYQLVAQNSAGSVEKEVRLFVHVEGEATPAVHKRVVELKPIPVAEFGRFVVQNHASNNRGFRDQYGTIEAEEEYPATIATTPKTRPLNRFANITVYDHNRVILAPLAGHDDCQRDYINACYVDGYSVPKKFIATQGPLPKTIVDFWRLVWQEKPPSIVMVTNIKEGNKIKCQQYWPETGNKSFGPFQITITDQQVFADYTIRTFQVTMSGSSNRPLRVTQFHFTAWPDHGVPDYATPILAFHRRVKSHHNPSRGPLLVHCSAGVGRTGTYMAIDSVLEQVQKEGVVDIAGTVSKMRKQRMKMVQTVEQYIFAHDAVLESLTCGDTQILPADIRTAIAKLERRDPQTNKTGYESQFKVLHQVSPKPEEVRTETAMQYPEKNRTMDFLPADRWRVLLKGEHPDYIHAVSVNGYKQQKAFIITQGPLQSTCRDFWKMVYDRKCGAIVMLSKLNENGKEVCHQYWPTTGIRKFGEYTVDLLGEEELEGFVLRTLSVLESRSGKAHQVMQFHIINWGPDGRCSNLKTVTDVIEEVSKVQRRTGNNPIVVHCSDTVSRSGMYCALATTIERCKTEGVVDVFQVVKALRVQRPGGVLTVEQYQVVFKAVLVFLDSFDTYANFQNI